MNIYPDWLLNEVVGSGGGTIIVGGLAVAVLDAMSVAVADELRTDNLGAPLVTGGVLTLKVAGALGIETELE